MDTKTPTLPPLRIGDLTAVTPIVQGGMGVGISMAGLASAVANEGGIGVIATPGIACCKGDMFRNTPSQNSLALIDEIRLARSMTKGLIGVNVMVALSNYEELARAAIAEGIDVIFSGAGLPLNLPKFLTPNSRTKLIPIVSSHKAANILCKKWVQHFRYVPDGFVVEGPMAGGHLGFAPENIFNPEYALEHIVPPVIATVRKYEEEYHTRIPVIVGGGLYTGADIRHFLSLGASGAQMATRFVTTHECDAPMEFKKAYLQAREEDMVIIHSPVGLPGRVIRNAFVDDILNGNKKPFTCPHKCIVTCDVHNAPFCIAEALLNAKRGMIDKGIVFAGHNAFRAKTIVSVRDLIRELRDGYVEADVKSVTSSLPAPRPCCVELTT